MFCNPTIPIRSLRNREFRSISRDSGNFKDTLLKYTIFRDHTIPIGDSTIATSAKFCVVPRKQMIVFNNVICFVIRPSLSRPSATANFAELRGIPVISIIVFNNVQCFVILPSLPGDSATANFAEFRGNPVISMIVFNNVQCFIILPSVPGATANSVGFR